MPVVARFYGIVIKMFFSEHGVPHFHAVYGEHVGVFAIESLELLEGDLPPRALRLVREWSERHAPTLQTMWDTKNFSQLPGLD
jgi:hypothetical protein